MKNFELKFWLSCMVMALCVGFTSCSDDDDEGIAGDANELIIGKWKVTDEYGWHQEKGEEKISYNYGKNQNIDWCDCINEIYTFRKDGTGSEDYNSTDSHEFDWNINGTKLTLDFGYSEKDVYTIVKMNAKNAVVASSYKDENEEGYYELVLTKQ